MAKSIEDLKVTRTFYRRDRDAFGNRTKEPYEQQIKRPVKVVSGWLRFGHYMIDAAIIFALNLGVEFVLMIAFGHGEMFATESSGGIADYVSFPNLVITVAYYFICEKTMQRTVGKFATNCVVINEYAEAPSAGALFGRSAARLIPFEAFSCLSERGWHDKMSKTYVVKTSERDELVALLNQEDGIFINASDEILD